MKSYIKYSLLVSCAMAGLPFIAIQADAQATQTTQAAQSTEATQAPAGAKTDDTIVEVIVTAQKRSETASKTPLAITAFTGDNLKASGVVSVSDLQNIAPAVNIGKDGFGVNINIRGVTTTDTTSKGEQGISFNVDGIPMGRPTEQGLSFFDVARVEVLRGPQGTLYGKSSTGGAINVITNKPAKAFEASADGDIGDYGTRRANLMLNVPAGDTLAFRAAINSNKRDGYVKLTGGYPARNDEDNLSGRLSMLWKPSENFSWLLSYTGGQVRGVGQASVPYLYIINNSGKAQRMGFGNPFGSQRHENFGNLTTEANATFGGVHATLVAAHMNFTANDFSSSTNDPNGNTAGPFSGFYGWGEYRGKVATDYSELRFSNSAPGKLDWVVGLNYAKEDIHESDHNWNAPIANPTLAGSTNGIDPLNNTVHTSSGIFAQATWHVTDNLRLTAGARQSKDQVRRIGTFAAGPGPWLDPNGNPCVAPNDCVGSANNGFESAKKVTWRLGADYQVAANQMIYASVATGYKAGGFNDFDPITNGTGTYEPEQLTAYEVGYKGRPFRNVQFNSDAFYYDYAKDQVSSLENINGNFVIFTRGVPVKISGWENELHYRPTANDTIDASLVLEKSKYVKFEAGLFGNVDWSGRSLDKTPDAVVSAGYSHVWQMADDNNFVFHVFSKYSSSYLLSDVQNATQYTQKAFTRSDITVTYNWKDGNYYVQGYVKNIEDKVQMIGTPGNFNPAVPLSASAQVSEPRMIGVRFGAKY